MGSEFHIWVKKIQNFGQLLVTEGQNKGGEKETVFKKWKIEQNCPPSLKIVKKYSRYSVRLSMQRKKMLGQFFCLLLENKSLYF